MNLFWMMVNSVGEISWVIQSLKAGIYSVMLAKFCSLLVNMDIQQEDCGRYLTMKSGLRSPRSSSSKHAKVMSTMAWPCRSHTMFMVQKLIPYAHPFLQTDQTLYWRSVLSPTGLQYVQKTKVTFIQCPLDIKTSLRHQGRGRYRQRGRFIKRLDIATCQPL